ncbi:TOPRS ligase, partial [Piaya cayana]|nr:TOPRS ligase [Piaya cayana]
TAMEPEWRCPICYDTRDDVANAIPCGHQFCLGCIVRCRLRKPSCPVCRGHIEVVRFSVRAEDDFIQFSITDPEESEDAYSLAVTFPSNRTENSTPPPPVSSPQGTMSPAEEGAVGPEAVGGLLPEVWAEAFQRHQHLLDLVLPWLRQELAVIYGTQWWMARSVESSILHGLCLYGLDEEVIVQMLQPILEEDIEELIHGFIEIIVRQCSEEARRLMHSSAATEEDNSMTSSSSSSSRGGTPSCSLASISSLAGSNTEEVTGMAEATVHGDPSCSQSTHEPAEQDQAQKGLSQVMAAGPSTQGCSHSPSDPSQDRDRSGRREQRAPKRRAPSPQDSPQPCKRP